jgi:hypothetical protein
MVCMGRIDKVQSPQLLRARARILQAVAGGNVLIGTPAELAGRFDLTARYVGVCLRALEHSQWVVVHADPDGCLHIRLGGSHGGPAPSDGR